MSFFVPGGDSSGSSFISGDVVQDPFRWSQLPHKFVYVFFTKTQVDGFVLQLTLEKQVLEHFLWDKVTLEGDDVHRRPFVGVSRARFWTRLPVLGAILSEIVFKSWQSCQKLTFEIPPRRALRGGQNMLQSHLPRVIYHRVTYPESYITKFSPCLLLSSLELGDTQVHEPEIWALLGTASHFCEVVVLKLRLSSITMFTRKPPWSVNWSESLGGFHSQIFFEVLW